MSPIHRCLALLLLFTAALPSRALSDGELQQRLAARFDGDRSGACVVAAVIDGPQVSRARICANPAGKARSDGGPGIESAFEIGSVSKTMAAFLVADLVDAGRWSLDDPIARHLPVGTAVPRQGDRQILVRDLLTHSAGLPRLPPGFKPGNPRDPYADITEADALAALGRVTLTEPIGSKSVYSNFGMMIVSSAAARAWRDEGADLEQVLKKRLFGPLKMDHAYIAEPPAGQRMAVGHLANGTATPAWHGATNLAGMGLVHATLDDMVAYTRAELGLTDTPLRSRLQMTQRPLAHGHGMNWFVSTIKGQGVVLHGGATFGFSTLVAMLPDRQRGVVLLADTALGSAGGLDGLGLSLLGLDVPVPRPRIAQPVPADLLGKLPGHYDLAGLKARVWVDDGHLMSQADGQPAFELLYDSHGDFYPDRLIDARLRPIVENGEVNRFSWSQGGTTLEGTRVGHAQPLTATRPEWKDWAGEYPLSPRFGLRVYERDGKLMMQGTAQPAFEATVTGTDRIEVQRFGAVLQFRRDAGGQVVGATLLQNGQALDGRKLAPGAAAKAALDPAAVPD
jgi:CubicO group peptidase (beta-lactamase class C family)